MEMPKTKNIRLPQLQTALVGSVVTPSMIMIKPPSGIFTQPDIEIKDRELAAFVKSHINSVSPVDSHTSSSPIGYPLARTRSRSQASPLLNLAEELEFDIRYNEIDEINETLFPGRFVVPFLLILR